MSPPQCNGTLHPHRTPSTHECHFVDKCCSAPHCIHVEAPFCGQMPQFTALHPRRSAILWINAKIHRTASTQKHHFVDKCHSAPYCIHVEAPFCGQTLQRTALHPRRSTILWTNAAIHRTASTQKCHFVDKCHSAPYCIHAEASFCGQMPQRTVLHPRQIPSVWKKACFRYSASAI